MSEIRIKFKAFVIGSVTVLFLLLYLTFRTPSCGNIPATIQSTSNSQQQVFERKNQSGSSAFTVYAITPTYARPVQKAELTRLVFTFSFFYECILISFFRQVSSDIASCAVCPLDYRGRCG